MPRIATEKPAGALNEPLGHTIIHTTHFDRSRCSPGRWRAACSCGWYRWANNLAVLHELAACHDLDALEVVE